MRLELGYYNALDELERIYNKYELSKSDTNTLRLIINDFRYCADRTERFKKLRAAQILTDEAFENLNGIEEVEEECPRCGSVFVEHTAYPDESDEVNSSCENCDYSWVQ